MSKISPGVLAPPHEVLTPDEWRARVRERRRSVSRSSHAQWAPPADRLDPVAVLEEQAKTRVPDLIPIRYGRMIASPFAYFRGAAAPMAWDLAHTPTPDIRVVSSGKSHAHVQAKAVARAADVGDLPPARTARINDIPG